MELFPFVHFFFNSSFLSQNFQSGLRNKVSLCVPRFKMKLIEEIPARKDKSGATLRSSNIRVVLESSCSTAVERTARNREVMGSIPSRCRAFSPSIRSNVSLNRSLDEVQHYCFSCKNVCLPV